MTTPTPGGQSTDLYELRARFEEFRATRRHGTRIPPELYRAAIELLDRYPENQVCVELQLDPGRFRRRRITLGKAPKSKRPQASRTRLHPKHSTEPLSFVEVPFVAHTHAGRTATRDVRVQIERVDGLRLTVNVEADEWPRVEALARQLFGGR